MCWNRSLEHRSFTWSKALPGLCFVFMNKFFTSRPTMKYMILSIFVSGGIRLATNSPSRRMVTLSATEQTSSSRCPINTMPEPLALRSLIILNKDSTSFEVNDAVTSSIRSTLAPCESALAMSTICLSAIDSLPTFFLRSNSWFKELKSSEASWLIFFQSTRPVIRFPGKRLTNTLSAIERSGNTCGSWLITAILFLIACCGLVNLTGFPSRKISPFFGWWMPPMIFAKVDFPAPFSPINAWISPGYISKSMSFRTYTPLKAIQILFNWIMGFFVFSIDNVITLCYYYVCYS